jgi:hypothetical protein
MKEILRTNNLALISKLCAMFDGAGFAYFVADFNASIVDGSIGVLPQRVMIAEDDEYAAKNLIRQEGLAEFLSESEPASPNKAP